MIRPTELEIPENDPFRNDVLNRKELEPPLTQFVTQASSSCVLALDSSWGSGKTTFLRMWQVKLKDAGHVCLYLNAWKTDFAEEPLVAVIGELSNAIKEFAPAGKPGAALRRNMKKAQKITESIAKRSIPAAVKLATLGILDAGELTETIVSDVVSEIAKDRIKDYEEGKSEIEDFRRTLTSLTTEVRETRPEVSSKVVFIIDELDRCRPTYAIQLLERIKHLFDVPGVFFVLGIDRSQLNHSIQALYGLGFDAQGYLRRFIDLDYRLPEPNAADYCSYLFKYFGIDELILKRQSRNKNHELNSLRTLLGCFMSAAQMSLREQEQTVARLRIVIQTIPEQEILFERSLSLLLFLREWNKDIFKSLLEGKIDVEGFIEEIKSLPGWSKVFEELDIDILEAVVALGLDELEKTQIRVKKYHESAKSDIEGPDSIKAQNVYAAISSIVRSSGLGRATVGFEFTKERLALTNSFVSYDN